MRPSLSTGMTLAGVSYPTMVASKVEMRYLVLHPHTALLKPIEPAEKLQRPVCHRHFSTLELARFGSADSVQARTGCVFRLAVQKSSHPNRPDCYTKA